MITARVLSTRTLLTCAAIGVATGLIGGIAGYLSAPISTAVPVLYGLVLGSHVLPGIVAQGLLRMPGVALLTHLLAALISSAIAPIWVTRYLGTALLIGLLQEGMAALARYRNWAAWRFVVGSATVGVILAVPIAIAADAAEFSPWAFAMYLASFVVGPVMWTLAGLWVARALRRAGITTR